MIKYHILLPTSDTCKELPILSHLWGIQQYATFRNNLKTAVPIMQLCLWTPFCSVWICIGHNIYTCTAVPLKTCSKLQYITLITWFTRSLQYCMPKCTSKFCMMFRLSICWLPCISGTMRVSKICTSYVVDNKLQDLVRFWNFVTCLCMKKYTIQEHIYFHISVAFLPMEQNISLQVLYFLSN